MFERYTDKAKRVIFYARLEASKLGAAAIGPNHLLLGLEREDKKAVKRFLANNPEMEKLRQQINPVGIPWPKLSTSVEIPLTELSKRALSAASDAAEVAHHGEVEHADLLCGLLSVAKG